LSLVRYDPCYHCTDERPNMNTVHIPLDFILAEVMWI
jgi:hypothetical protein